MKRWFECLFLRVFIAMARSEVARHQEAMSYHASGAWRAARDLRDARAQLARLDCPKRALQLVSDRKVPR